MFNAPAHPTLVPYEGSFAVANAPTAPTDAPSSKELAAQLDALSGELDQLQRSLYAMNKWAVLLVFQGIDAAGKDGAIRAVMNRLDPAGVQVHSFRPPSPEERDHDFLWRATKLLPGRGRIGVFNRSHYEEVLIVRVHPELLDTQQLPFMPVLDQLWSQRYESIRDYERHLARNGVAIVKFWLNLSKEEQRRRFLSRLDDPGKYWKFEEADIRERGYWDDYQQAFEAMLNTTSRPWAPWYAIPADDKSYARVQIAEILVETLRSLNLEYPKHRFTRSVEEMRAMLDE